MVNQASASGADLETRVREFVRECRVRPYKQTPLGVKGPFGEAMQSDVLIDRNAAFPLGLVIQCKAQHKGGSTHLKLLYLHECIKHCYSQPAIIVCDGRSKEIIAAYEWLKQRVGGMLFGVFWFEEFTEWFKARAARINDF